jgi:hypothetical protein
LEQARQNMFFQQYIGYVPNLCVVIQKDQMKAQQSFSRSLAKKL